MKDTLLCGDCAEKMRDLAPGSIDAIVTDPPYGIAFMGSKWDNFGTNCGNDSIDERKRKAKEYRATHPGVGNYPNGHGVATSFALRNFQTAMTPIFAEALRVAKPGAHLLAFGGTRTYHRLAAAIEDAGWEIRDCIMWVYGSGFPKSMDVAKAIDKAKGYKGEVIGTRIVDVGMQGGNMHAGREHKQQQQICALSPEAAAWQGWGTCLKPAVEPIVVARKPLDGTVAANVLKHGTGALNTDACRVPVAQDDETFAKNPHTRSKGTEAYEHNCYGKYNAATKDYDPSQGRWPANLCHDGSPEVLALFPNNVKGGTWNRTAGARPFNNNGKETNYKSFGSDNFIGSAARFFYCAKASRAERGEGNVHPTVKPIALMRWLVRLVTRPGGLVLDPFMGSGTTGIAAIQEGMNFVGIERDEHYYEIASRRIAAAKPEPAKPAQQKLPL